MRRICLIAAAILLLVCVQQAWAAPPGLPSTFYGSVRIDGNNVPAGSYVSARIGGITYKRVQVIQDATHGMVYALDIPADDATTPAVEGGRNGDTVVFVAELPGGSTRTMMQRGTWRSGGSMELHLGTSVDAVIPLVFSR